MWRRKRASKSPDPLPTIPGYKVLEELGRGGMGVVYKARRTRPLHSARLVALKMMLGAREADELELVRFRVEAEAVACLNHPNIVRIHDVDVHAGVPYLVLEFAAGGSLAAHIGKRPQPPGWSARVVYDAARALAHAHARGILHRDLKPANILLTETGVPKITDFGLAKFTRPLEDVVQEHNTLSFYPQGALGAIILEFVRAAQGGQKPVDMTEFAARRLCERILAPFGPQTVSRATESVTSFVVAAQRQPSGGEAERVALLELLTRSGTVLGTPQYMAPEQARAANDLLGPTTDVYALGAILYKLLTGRPPFDGESVADVLDQVLNYSPPPPEPPELGVVCMKCVDKDIRQRYATAAELADDLQQFLDRCPAGTAELEPVGAAVAQGHPEEDATAPWQPVAAVDAAATTKRWWQFWK